MVLGHLRHLENVVKCLPGQIKFCLFKRHVESPSGKFPKMLKERAFISWLTSTFPTKQYLLPSFFALTLELVPTFFNPFACQTSSFTSMLKNTIVFSNFNISHLTFLCRQNFSLLKLDLKPCLEFGH